MNIKSFLMFGLVALAGSSFLVTTNSGCDQPAVKCASARGDYVVRYTYVSGSDDCKALTGEKVGMQTYNAVGNEGKPDLDRPSVAIQADGIGSLRDKSEKEKAADPDPNHHAYALGNFNANVPAGDICLASSLTPAE